MPVPQLDNVIFIIEENKSYSAVTSTYASSIPYFNALRTTGTWATGKTTNHADGANYFQVGSPSAPNYLALTSGRLLQNGSDAWNAYSYQNIVDLMVTAHVTWGVYCENLPSNWEAHPNVGLYAQRHNPFGYYTDVYGDSTRTPHVKDYTAFVPGTERFQWITPNLTDDGHTDPGGHSSPITYELGFTDAFLKTLIPNIMNSAAFAPGKKAVIIIVWDEDSGTTNSPVLFLGPGAATVTSHVKYTHYSLLATLESMLGLGSLGQNDATATAMNDMVANSGGGTSDFPTWLNKSFSSETFQPVSTTQGGNFNPSLGFAALSSETFAPTSSAGVPIVSAPVMCGSASLPQSTGL